MISGVWKRQAVLHGLVRRRAQLWDNPDPIRAEMFGAERLEDHARSLARAQPTASGRTHGLSLTSRLGDNDRVLHRAYITTLRAAEAGAAITPAAEWLIDNFYLVERQIREIRANLPPAFYRQLPKLMAGPFAGYPRVLGIAWADVAHTDSVFDPLLLNAPKHLQAPSQVSQCEFGMQSIILQPRQRQDRKSPKD